MTSMSELFQMDLFGGEQPVKKDEKSKVKPTSKPVMKADGTKSTTGTTETKKANDLEGVNVETLIYYAGFRFHDDDPKNRSLALCELFTDVEIEDGLLQNDGKRVKITSEDIRYRLENGIGISEAFPEFVKDFTSVQFNKEQNILTISVSGKKKGASCPSPLTYVGNKVPKIPFQLLCEFIACARKFSFQYQTELHANIYYSFDNEQFFLRIPPQKVTALNVFIGNDHDVQQYGVKIMEIHSHHMMNATPSSTDNSDDQIPTLMYGIVGNLNQSFPSVHLRYFHPIEMKHVQIDLQDVFDMAYHIPSYMDNDFPQVEVINL